MSIKSVIKIDAPVFWPIKLTIPHPRIIFFVNSLWSRAAIYMGNSRKLANDLFRQKWCSSCMGCAMSSALLFSNTLPTSSFKIGAQGLYQSLCFILFTFIPDFGLSGTATKDLCPSARVQLPVSHTGHILPRRRSSDTSFGEIIRPWYCFT